MVILARGHYKIKDFRDKCGGSICHPSVGLDFVLILALTLVGFFAHTVGHP